MEAAGWLALDLLSLGSSKVGKAAKVASKADTLFDAFKSSKLVTKVDDLIDTGKSFVKSGIDKVLDKPLSFGFGMVTDTGARLSNTTTLREVGQQTIETLANFFKKNGGEVSKPYKNSRPSYGKGQVEEVFDNAKKANNGKVIDPSGKEITWDKSKSRNGQWDMGHIPGEKYADMHQKYMNGDISKEEFLEWYRNPENYRPELPSTNRSHRYE